jgi:hypothetical protein
VRIIKENRWEADVDLVAGGHAQILLAQGELDEVRLDIEAARASGTRKRSKRYMVTY